MHPIFYITIPIGLLVVIFLGFALWVHRSAPLEIKLKYQHLFPSALPPDFISEVERQAIERGELKIEPYQKTPSYFILVIFGVWIAFILLRHYLNKVQADCGLIMGIFPSFWAMFIFYPLLIMWLIGLGYQLYLTYKKAIDSGFTVKANRKSSKYRFFVKASHEQVRVEFGIRFLILATMIITFSVMFGQIFNKQFVKLDMTNAPKTQLPTYQIASQKLQQQCLAKLEK